MKMVKNLNCNKCGELLVFIKRDKNFKGTGDPREYRLFCWCKNCDKEFTVVNQKNLGFFITETFEKEKIFKDASILEEYIKKYPNNFKKEIWNSILESESSSYQKYLETKYWVCNKIAIENNERID